MAYPMKRKTKGQEEEKEIEMPSAEEVARELGKAKSIDDFYGKDGIFSRLFSKTIEQMLEAELTAELGYGRYDAEGRNSGNNRNGHYTRKMRTTRIETGSGRSYVRKRKMGAGKKSLPVHVIQLGRIAYTWLGKLDSAIYFHPFSRSMA